ncbi:CD63 antigen-like protein [Leptotrombidium deliense]|uniref:CD63 antigen-like protein n=1 Tax=Leptotrombidium deliense TaxID=299467 RepID=A0A443SFS8_9ACAR|nr:CD63 antigen-like protein [Leptotrombidium deliense]
MNPKVKNIYEALSSYIYHIGNNIPQIVHESVKKKMMNYYSEPYIVDEMQWNLACCGASAAGDWFTILRASHLPYPFSCCPKKSFSICELPYPTSCTEAVLNVFEKYKLKITLYVSMMIVMEVIGIVYAIYFTLKSRKQKIIVIN